MKGLAVFHRLTLTTLVALLPVTVQIAAANPSGGGHGMGGHGGGMGHFSGARGPSRFNAGQNLAFRHGAWFHDRADRFRDDRFRGERFGDDRFRDHRFRGERFGDDRFRDRDDRFFRRNFFFAFDFAAFGFPGWWYPYYDGYPYPYDQEYSYDDGPAYDYQYWETLAVSVQTRLAEQGYYHGAADGIIGSESREAIRKFQAAQGLPVTGKIDPKLLKALGISYRG